MWRKIAHSTGDSESASRDAAALWVGTHTLQTWATPAGMKEVGNEAKNPSRVAATSCGVALSGICMVQTASQEGTRQVRMHIYFESWILLKLVLQHLQWKAVFVLH